MVEPPCARVFKFEECTCALKSCTKRSKTAPDNPAGVQGKTDPGTANSNTVTRCHYCGFHRDHRRARCVNCGRPNWACSQCGDTVRKSPRAFRWLFVGGVVSIFVCSTCECSFGPAFDRFWSNFFKEVSCEVR